MRLNFRPLYVALNAAPRLGGGRPALKAFLPVAAMVAVLLSGCTGARSLTHQEGSPALSEASTSTAPTRVLIFVPGISGTELIDGDGVPAWGDGRRLIFPRDGAYPIAIPQPEGAPPSPLRAGRVMEQVTIFGLIRSPVYGPLLQALESFGYVRGELDAPRSEDTLFLFPYDWRRDNTVIARELERRLTELHATRGGERLSVDFLCQSNGAHICRYAAKYGGATLEEAERGEGGLPPEIDLGRVILVGSANAGSLRILRDLHRGRRYVPLIGRTVRPEVPFTAPSLYQDLAIRGPRYFIDERGRPLDVDLWDPEAWERYGWSIFAPDAQARIAPYPEIFGGIEDQRASLADSLRLAERFQAVLARDSPHFSTRSYHFVQNVAEPTSRRVVLTDEGELLFLGDPELHERPDLAALVHAPGDGHATFDSQMAISPQERRVLTDIEHVRGSHFRMILAKKTQQALRRFLFGPLPDESPRDLR